MRRTNSLVLLLFLAVVPAFALAISGIGIGIQNAMALAGSVNVSIPINLSNNESVALFESSISHPSYLIFKGVQNTTRMPDAAIEANAVNSTVIKVAALVPGNISAGNGTIMNLLFDVHSLGPSGSYAVNVSNAAVLKVGSGDLTVAFSGSTFTII